VPETKNYIKRRKMDNPALFFICQQVNVRLQMTGLIFMNISQPFRKLRSQSISMIFDIKVKTINIMLPSCKKSKSDVHVLFNFPLINT